MGTEVAVSFSTLRAQLENERSSLYKIDENIKKIVQTPGRFNGDRFNNTSGDYVRGGPRLGGRHSFPDIGKNDDKRRHETKTVFSRLSARAGDSDGEEATPLVRARMSSAVSRELPSRAAVLRAQAPDAQARTRNRRIFGSLLGTLQKFKQEEIGLQTKEEKKAQVERKIEEQARVQKEKEIKERRTLFAEREHKKSMIKALEVKMARVQEFEKWEVSQKCLGNYILTKTRPQIYWIPKKMEDKATEKLNSSRKYHERCMSQKRQELQQELVRIEERCLRPRGAKENDPANHDITRENEDADKGSKRDKFAMDVDNAEREDSDADDRHDNHNETNENVQTKEEKVSDESKMDTTVDQEVTLESEQPQISDTIMDVNMDSQPEDDLQPEESLHPEENLQPGNNLQPDEDKTDHS